MAAFIFISIILFSLLLALMVNRNAKKGDVADFLVGGRSFGVIILFFLAVGEIYSVATVIGLPGSIYAKGVNYGIWFMAFLLLIYPVGYFLAPKIWQAGKHYDAMTAPDLFKSHFKNRPLELVVAVCYLMFLIPWAQMQFQGLIVALNALGYEIEPVVAVIIAGAIAFIYISISGVKAPAMIAVLKDILLFGAIVGVGWAAFHKMGGVEELFIAARDQGASIAYANQDEVVFSMSTIVFQSMAFYCLPFMITILFTSKSAGGIKRAKRFMPLYMLMFPFLIAAAYYAMVKIPNLPSPNHAFIATAIDVLPSWAVGFVAAGAALSGLILISVISLSVGGIFTRNLVSNVPLQSQKRLSQIVILVYLIISMILTVVLPSLMLNLMNTAYAGFGQMLPGLLSVVFFKRATAAGVLSGLVVGIAAVFVMYFSEFNLYAINIGLIALVLNSITVFVVSALTQRSAVPGLSTKTA
ncbi:MAG: sodium:solute symporter family protein [Paenalcaligenes sp.]